MNYHSQCATSDGRRQMLWLVAQLHRLSAKLHRATRRPAAQDVLKLRAADTLAEADAVQIRGRIGEGGPCMAANASPEQMRRHFLNSKLRNVASFRLAFDCNIPSCWGERTISIGTIARRQNPDKLVHQLTNRLRCVGCGRKPQVFHIESGRHMAQINDWSRVTLQGLFVVSER